MAINIPIVGKSGASKKLLLKVFIFSKKSSNLLEINQEHKSLFSINMQNIHSSAQEGWVNKIYPAPNEPAAVRGKDSCSGQN